MLDCGGDKHIEKQLKSWKTILVGLDDGLRLRSKEIAVGLFSLHTITTFLVWIYEPPLVSILAFLGIIMVVSEQCVPLVMKNVFGKSDEKIWNADKTIKYKKLCKEIDFYLGKMEDLGKWLSDQKEDNPLVYVSVVTAALSLICYLSFKFNNIWAGYALSLLVIGVRAYYFEHRHKDFLERILTKKD